MAEKKLSLTNIVSKMLTRKNPDEALAGAKEGGLEKTLGVWDLIILGVGAIIGSGILLSSVLPLQLQKQELDQLLWFQWLLLL